MLRPNRTDEDSARSSREAAAELCVVIDGSWQLKLDDTLLDGGPSDVFRVAREVARGF